MYMDIPFPQFTIHLFKIKFTNIAFNPMIFNTLFSCFYIPLIIIVMS